MNHPIPMKRPAKLLFIAALVGLGFASTSTAATLIAHYTFDVDNSGFTPDSIGSAQATLGSQVSISTTESKIGGGSLQMTASGSETAPGGADGAVTSNNFSLGTGARTYAFWWTDNGADTQRGAYFSMGTTDTGTRFEVRETTTTTLRVEIAGSGENSNAPTLDDGAWHFITVVMPAGGSFNDIAWYVDGSSTNLNPGSASDVAVNTGIGPLVFGSSINIVDGFDATPNGFLDDFQLYDGVLTTSEIQFLYNNPGSVIPEPAAALLGSLGMLVLLRRRRSL